jgi:hypothetical protein
MYAAIDNQPDREDSRYRERKSEIPSLPMYFSLHRIDQWEKVIVMRYDLGKAPAASEASVQRTTRSKENRARLPPLGNRAFHCFSFHNFRVNYFFRAILIAFYRLRCGSFSRRTARAAAR